jgi:proline dehydrogenase
MGFFDRTVAGSVKFMPRALVRKVAMHYVAGETLEEAIEQSRRLNDAGCMVTIDLLGEAIETEAEANASADTYLRALDAVHGAGIDGNVSIKPTHFGLSISKTLFVNNVRRVADRARELDNFVRIDMEDTPYTDDTLAVFRALREEGYDHVGTVLQTMLRRSLDDVKALEDLSPSFRICKGVYRESEEHAWQEYDEVNASFLEILGYTLPRRSFYIGIATHDDPVIEGAEALIAEHGLTPDQYEFQMLLGVRPRIRDALVERGHRVRVYVPFGTSWYAYCVRRLKENPKYAGYITKDVLRNPTMLFGGKR